MSGVEWVRRIKSGEHSFPPAGVLLGFRMLEVKVGSTTIEMPITPEVLNRSGGVQGGILAALADANAGTALGTLEQENESHATLDLKLNFLRPAPVEAGAVIATAKVLHRSKRIAHVRGEIRTPDGTLICHATSTWVIRKNPVPTPERE